MDVKDKDGHVSNLVKRTILKINPPPAREGYQSVT